MTEYLEQENIPSQRLPRRIPYSPRYQADASQFPAIQAPHPPGYGGVSPVYVVSTFDARPIRAVDFSTYSGTNPNDVFNGPALAASLFYDVQPGRVAIVRDWHIFLVPLPVEAGPPPIAPSGASNFVFELSFLVNGVFQEAMSGLQLWSLVFGDVFGDAYFLAQPGDRIEMRLTPGAGTFAQCLMAMHGNLLSQRGDQIDYEPGTDAVLPVHESAVQEIYTAASIDDLMGQRP